MRKHRLKASFTIEMSLLIPLILFIFMEIVLVIFYYHDKNIMNGASYETAVVGSMKLREKEEITEEELEDFCRDRMRGKCIFLTNYQIFAGIDEKEVQVEIAARKKGFKLSVVKRAAVTEPEKRIRNIRRLDIKNGEKNND